MVGLDAACNDAEDACDDALAEDVLDEEEGFEDDAPPDGRAAQPASASDKSSAKKRRAHR